MVRFLSIKWTESIFHNCCLENENTKEKAKDRPVDLDLRDREPALDTVITLERAPSFTAFASRLESEALEATDTLLPSILQTFVQQLNHICDKNILNPGTSRPEVSEEGWSTESQCLSAGPCICEPLSPGYVTNYIDVPVNHSLGFWVWRPSGVYDGSIVLKTGPVEAREMMVLCM